MNRKAAFVVKRFPDDRYTALFSPNSGFFARIEDAGEPEPFWSTHGPELLDVAITNWCDKGCSFCYRKSDSSGLHMSLEDYREVMVQAKGMHVFQVALGGGNPNQHPEFPEILRITREDFGIVPNYTTNGRGLTPDVISATARYVGAVAVSAYAPKLGARTSGGEPVPQSSFATNQMSTRMFGWSVRYSLRSSFLALPPRKSGNHSDQNRGGALFPVPIPLPVKSGRVNSESSGRLFWTI